MKKFISYLLDTLIYVINLIKKREFKAEGEEEEAQPSKRRRRNRKKKANVQT